MGEENTPDPKSLDKDSELIKSAQTEIGTIDVLVCGSCHEVFHFVEEFEKHKSENCTGNSTLKETFHGDSSKSQVWAFTLWKNSNYRSGKGGEMPSSWNIYQEWCNLDTKIKDTWITAGKNVQTFTNLSEAKLVEVKVKPQVYSRRTNQKVMVTVPSINTGEKGDNDDPLDEGEIKLSQLSEAQRKALKAQTEANKLSEDADPLAGTTTHDMNDREDKENANDLIKRGIVKPVQLNSDVTILPSNKKQNTKENNSSKNEEYGVDKIVSKRYNPRKKTFEYLVKWEDSPQNEYTWEPVANLDSCKDLVDEYEANLKKQRMQKAQAAALQKQYEKKKQKADSGGEILAGRPQRSSKQKALNQVKAWCGDISDDEESSSKRKRNDDSDSDSYDKKIKMETESDTDDDSVPLITVKKVSKTSSVNGVGKKGSSIGKILIPDSKGIVRINQKQASELSSGVYIMSKTAGIIKLDSNASKFATSGGQAIVKVEPRIGQTQIKVVKRDAGTSSVKLSPKPRVTLKTVTKTIKDKSESRQSTTSNTSGLEKRDTLFDNVDDEESDDGLPDLEFPTDLPLPSPDSPPGEFVLDPETGKIAGQEYPEETQVIPVVVAPQEEEMEKKIKAEVVDVEKKEDIQEAESGLENLVKLAAADILDDELETSENVKEVEQKVVEEKPKPKPKPSVAPIAQSTPVKTTVIPKTQYRDTPTPSTSILQRKLLSTPKQTNPVATTVRKVIPGVATLKKTSTTPVITPVRKNVMSKPKQYVPMNTPPTINKVRQSYSNKNMNVHKKIGQTTIYKTVQKPQQKTTNVHQIIHPQTLLQPQVQKQQRQQKQVQSVMMAREVKQQQQQQQQMHISAAEREVINMPLLSIEEPTATTSAEVQQQAMEGTVTAAATISLPEGITDLSTLAELNDSETPLIITGEDGTIYQVAGQNEQGQTILISQGADGQSQCLVVATESLQLEESQAVQITEEGVIQAHEPMLVQQAAETTETEAGIADEESMVAQLISADPPSPGGRRNVTVMLPDGSCVTMQVTQEQYESLELDK